MVFVKHNSLKSNIFFNPIFIPGFSGSGSRVRVQGPESGSRVQGPGPGSGPGFRSSHILFSINEEYFLNTFFCFNFTSESLKNVTIGAI